jgi:hypothetical protein
LAQAFYYFLTVPYWTGAVSTIEVMSHHHSVIVTVLSDLFGWPGGILLGNLVWLPIQYAAIAWRLARHHKAVHGRLDGQDDQLAAIVKHLGVELHPGDGSP